MPSSPFVGAWRISIWIPDSVDVSLPEGVPADGVREDGPLDIAPDPTSSSDTFRLDWLTQSGEPCSVSGLHSNEAQTELRGQNLLVSFGAREVSCDVTVTLTQTTDHKQLSCSIHLPELPSVGGVPNLPETGGGTFTATASPGG